ncbi:hypothetical protein [Luteimonas sp. FCS-9]|uniref:hypothetical protein n=1 Tax=Luteimonas sp. FCS-9 TaxID=1547516 RepID=UPI0012E0AB98|nr:hypothetical protein [Luteimonas sp. FCS-9]
MPGDLIDARFNSVILEHVFQWMRGDGVALWSPGFFYPYQNTLALSDNHFGTAGIYALFRLSGLEREAALTAWLMMGSALNFLAAHYALRKLGLRPLGAAAGAFVFAFSLPVMAQQTHAQFAYRAFVPLAFLSCWQWLQSGRLTSLALCAIWLGAQFYCAIYTGVFTLYVMVAAVVGWWLLGQVGATLKKSREWWLSASSLSRWGSLFAVFVAAMAVGALLLKYHAVSSGYGFERPRGEILEMLPRVSSWLISDFSGFSNWVGGWISGVPMRHEHQLFAGIAVLLFALIGGLVALRSIEHALIGKLAVLIILILGVTTISFHGVSLYRLALHLPGISSVRAVTRVVLVLVLPIGILVGIGVDRWVLLFSKRGTGRKAVAMASAYAFLLFELLGFHHISTPVEHWHQRQRDFARRMPISDGRSVIYADRSADAPHLDDLDAMIYAQDHALPAVNGYSGYVPPGAGVTGQCESPETFLAAYSRYSHVASEDVEELRERLVVVPKPVCANGRVMRFSGRIPNAQVAAIRLQVVGVKVDGKRVLADVRIVNDSDRDFSTLEVDGRNVRLSWRLLEGGRDEHSVGWVARKDLSLVLAPGEETEIRVEFDAKSGEYRLEFSLVQEMMLWFHDHGMRVPSVDVRVE